MSAPRVVAGLLLLALAAPGHAHRPSDAFVALELSGGEIVGSWDIALRDVAAVVNVDTDRDGALTWGELRQSRAALAQIAGTALEIRSDIGACPLEVADLLVNERLDGPYAHLVLRGRCAGAPATASVRYRLLFDLDPTHRGLLVLRARGTAHSAVLSPTRDSAQFELGRPTASRPFADYFREGVHHIWIGVDHVLFLVVLLLPCVLVRDGGRWRAAPGARAVAIDVVGVVTAFTLAHSVTLSLAALDVLRLPSAPVESAIALSVALAALNNVCPVVTRARWAVALLFGLVHGFGFASALGELGLPAAGRLLSLLAFNLGVEAGQLAIVLVLLPAAWAMRRFAAYRGVMAGGSVAVAMAGAAWFAERSGLASIVAFAP